ncbi:hypothetical protein IHQ71_00305 [Rhizobium sp. TH2]|uniref:hypothetical protein n=1 Tax=Rhizobium sp. TH2 TaxID=2775403 RepID=UPI0021572F6B|nr:hypothetical protein [Rhizobium sp. TH2]UVC09117.1 hypothetical protein IHQ71_00305 [Rhizobium sp. TH2]
MLSIEALKNKPINIEFKSTDSYKLSPTGFDYQSLETKVCTKWIQHKAKFDITTNDNQISMEEVDQSIQENLYFVTIQFNPKYVPANFKPHQLPALADAIASFYNSMCKDFIDFAFGGNAKFLPLFIAYFDGDGSRHSDHVTDIQTPHYHGLFLLHPKTRVAFEAWLSGNSIDRKIDGHPYKSVSARDHFPLETVNFSKFDPDRGSLEDMVSYVTKYARNDRYVKGNGDFFELSTVFPRVPKWMYPFYKRSNIIEAGKLASFEKNN